MQVILLNVSEIDGKGKRFKVLSLSPSLHKKPTSGYSHQWYNSEPVTKSESRRLRTDDIACGSGHSATVELPFARESCSVSNIRSFPLNDSADNSRLKRKTKKTSHLSITDIHYVRGRGVMQHG